MQVKEPPFLTKTNDFDDTMSNVAGTSGGAGSTGVELAESEWAELSISNQLLLAEAHRRGWKCEVLEGASNMAAVWPPDSTPIVFQRARTELGSAIGHRLAENKAACAVLLERRSLPTAKSLRCVLRFGDIPESDLERLTQFVRANQQAGCATVIKPTDGAHGEGVVLDIAPPRANAGSADEPEGLTDAEVADLTAAARVATSMSMLGTNARKPIPFLAQRQAVGTELRILVIAGGVFAASMRTAPVAVGDGESSVADLVDALNTDPTRGPGHTHPRSVIDAAAVSAYLGMGALARVPAAGEKVQLLGISNLSAGGNAVDVTDRLHPEIKQMCVEVAEALMLDLVGIDVIVADMEAPLASAGCCILEANTSPGLRMHAFPSEGTARNAAPFILDAILARREASAATAHALRQKAATRRQLRMLIVMDHATSKKANSLWSMARALADHPAAEGVFVASRFNPANTSFFYPPHDAESVWVHKVGPKFGWKPLTEVNFATARQMSLADFDVVFPRLSRPVTRAFLDGMARMVDEWRIINGTTDFLRVCSKGWLPEVAELCAPLAYCKTVAEVEAFRAEYPAIVIKPVQDGGGKGITRVAADGRVFVEHDKVGVAWEEYVESHLRGVLDNAMPTPRSDGSDPDYDLFHGVVCMKFLEGVREGDKRTVVIDGRIIASSIRLPQQGNWVCNASMGGTSHVAAADDDEVELIRKLDPVLRKHNITFYGIDTLVGDDGKRVLSELNASNVGGLAPMEEVSGEPVVARGMHALWTYIVQRVSDHEGWVV
ncbi:glutathione synthetase [Thecamonas trahens ATCC 50062]|uniref:Glutathione synthetase n=1 Tax=Thecamonas trahens ATCC 50062 TaxID=461836 RepID=A0A0L0DSG7_THETB|nr:glutathione synthetase [Thecamonas trahens ATCC 50062]KNC55289.1 glutathione synthetase [Thecamonas trahens ATCC 50062]|eukprot:XP_013753110.1 glutathione synthetase [Thecamonas trahens ATCC 50062]